MKTFQSTHQNNQNTIDQSPLINHNIDDNINHNNDDDDDEYTISAPINKIYLITPKNQCNVYHNFATIKFESLNQNNLNPLLPSNTN